MGHGVGTNSRCHWLYAGVETPASLRIESFRARDRVFRSLCSSLWQHVKSLSFSSRGAVPALVRPAFAETNAWGPFLVYCAAKTVTLDQETTVKEGRRRGERGGERSDGRVRNQVGR